MQKWEYEIVEISPPFNFAELLKERGDEGWELVTKEYVEWLYTADKAHRIPCDKYVLTFKRTKEL